VEIEERLRDIRQRLAEAAEPLPQRHAAVAAAAPATGGEALAAEARVAVAEVRLAALERQVAQLSGVRDRFDRAAARIIVEMEEVRRRVALDEPAGERPGHQPPADQPLTGMVHGRDAQLFSGAVELRVEPVLEIAAVAALEEALEAIQGVDALYVTALQDGAVTMELTLAQPVPLITELRRRYALAFTVDGCEGGRLTLRLTGAPRRFRGGGDASGWDLRAH
jgi:hypothetical protein